MKRRKSMAAISRGLNTPDLPPGVTLQRQPRSFGKVPCHVPSTFLRTMPLPENATVVVMAHTGVHTVIMATSQSPEPLAAPNARVESCGFALRMFRVLAQQNLASLGSGSSRSNRRNSSSPTRLVAPAGDRPASRDPSPPLSPGRPPLILPAPDAAPSRTQPSAAPPPSARSAPSSKPDAGSAPAPAPLHRVPADGSSHYAAAEREPASSRSHASGGGSSHGGVPQGAHHARLPSYAESRSELWGGSSSSASAPVSRQVSETSTATDAAARALLQVRTSSRLPTLTSTLNLTRLGSAPLRNLNRDLRFLLHPQSTPTFASAFRITNFEPDSIRDYVQRASQTSVLMGAKPGAAPGRSTSGVLDGAASFLVKAGSLANSASHRVTVGAGSASKQVLSTAAAAGRKVKAAIGQDDGLLPVISARVGADSGPEAEASQRTADGASQVGLSIVPQLAKQILRSKKQCFDQLSRGSARCRTPIARGSVQGWALRLQRLCTS